IDARIIELGGNVQGDDRIVVVHEVEAVLDGRALGRCQHHTEGELKRRIHRNRQGAASPDAQARNFRSEVELFVVLQGRWIERKWNLDGQVVERALYLDLREDINASRFTQQLNQLLQRRDLERDSAEEPAELIGELAAASNGKE